MTNDSNDMSFVICHFVTQMTNDFSHSVNIVYFVKICKSFYLFKVMEQTSKRKFKFIYVTKKFSKEACIFQIT